MKKILLSVIMIFATNVANAYTEYYSSIKTGLGGVSIYVDGDNSLGDYLVASAGNGYKYNSSGTLWEISPAVGIDWTHGYRYNGWFHLRLEGEVGYNSYHEDGKLRYDYTITDKIKIKTNQIFLLANGYADFRIDNVTPYVGLGLGYGFGKEEVTLANAHGEFNDAVKDDGMVYALHLGIGYKVSDKTTFDIGGRRVYIPTTDGGKYLFDTIRLGIRFRI